MRWVKLDAGFYLHPKAIAAGRDGRDVFVAGLCWSAQQMTDGVIPAHTLPLIGALCGVSDVAKAASDLVDVGLWNNHVDGWEIHGFLEWQESKEDRDAWLESERERKRQAREAKRQAIAAKAERVEPRTPKRAEGPESVRADTSRNPRGFRSREEEEDEDEERSVSQRPDYSRVAALGIGTETTTTSSDGDSRADRALRTVAARLAATAKDPAAYKASIIRNGADHLDALRRLATADHQADPDELAERYLASRSKDKPAAPTTCPHCNGPRHAPGTGPCPTLLLEGAR
jgi:hypothetical protein